MEGTAAWMGQFSRVGVSVSGRASVPGSSSVTAGHGHGHASGGVCDVRGGASQSAVSKSEHPYISIDGTQKSRLEKVQERDMHKKKEEIGIRNTL